MDAVELRAALVKLDPATTVTPIGPLDNSSNKQQQQRSSIVDLDKDSTANNNAAQQQLTRKSAAGNQQQRGAPAPPLTLNQPLKCTITEVR